MSDFGVPSLLAQLSAEEVEVLSSLARRQNYADGEMIHEEGDLSQGMSVVIAGQVKLVKRQANGNLLLETSVNPGQNYGDVTAIVIGRRTHGAMACGDTVIDHFSPQAFEKLLDHHGILRALHRIATYRLVMAVEMLDDIRALPVEGRLGKLLGKMIDADTESGQIECLQEDLANILGVSSMTIAKALSVLRRKGLVTTGYRRIQIPDIERLREWVAGLHA